ncbi:unnamed protein product [Prorocentrum cordatum]|uniref:DNA polymerase kappa n=1 Tax=Prorocentrum cordatum TaxID=2364126 RepID=A0ABN9PUR9_9DINO|nr:unnamed protein product [Polarella glacialis]
MGQTAAVATDAAILAADAMAASLRSSDLGVLLPRQTLESVKVVARFEADDGVRQQHEFTYITPPGDPPRATAGWLLDRVSETVHRMNHQGAPRVIGLRVLNAAPRSLRELLANPHVAAACGAFVPPCGQVLTATTRREQRRSGKDRGPPFAARPHWVVRGVPRAGLRAAPGGRRCAGATLSRPCSARRRTRGWHGIRPATPWATRAGRGAQEEPQRSLTARTSTT